MEYALALVVLLAIAALVVSGPLRRAEPAGPDATAGPVQAERRAELEAAKQVKYREIRDAELDFRMGKLSEADFQATDRELRAQTIAIVRELDRSREERPVGGAGGAGDPIGRSGPADRQRDPDRPQRPR